MSVVFKLFFYPLCDRAKSEQWEHTIVPVLLTKKTPFTSFVTGVSGPQRTSGAVFT